MGSVLGYPYFGNPTNIYSVSHPAFKGVRAAGSPRKSARAHLL